jgi:hypothetical protein
MSEKKFLWLYSMLAFGTWGFPVSSLYYLARPLQRSRGKAFDIFLHTMRHERYPFDFDFDFDFDLVIQNIPKPHFNNFPQSQDNMPGISGWSHVNYAV